MRRDLAPVLEARLVGDPQLVPGPTAMRKDYTAAWLIAAAALIALWASQTDQPLDLNNNRCLEAPGGTDTC